MPFLTRMGKIFVQLIPGVIEPNEAIVSTLNAWPSGGKRRPS
jgi:hypothetical protein